jgi:tetratricopeptide (TPR) repeat protein
LIQGLAYPDWETDAEAPADADLTAYDAVKLFLHSARRVRPHFELTDDDLAHVTRLCRLVDGMPLGIELAAAWVDMLSLADIAAETQRSLDFLETVWRDAPARHHSIRAVFDASWERIGEAEREVFPQLSVFRGGFTRQAAQEVAGAHLRALVALADKSLLQYEQGRDRYRIHELLRQYGADRLGTDPDREVAVRGRHCAYYCAWLEERGADLKGPRQQAALAEIEADIENAQAAWGWAVSQRWVAGIDQALDGLCGFLDLRHRYQDGETTSRMAAAELGPEELPEDELASAERQRALAKALARQCRCSHALGRLEVANELLRQCRALLEGPALADQDTRAIQALHAFAVIPKMPLSLDGFYTDLDETRRRCEQGLALYRELGDEWGVADALTGLGFAARLSVAYDEAKQLYEESLASYRALGNQWRVADALNGLGWVARDLGAYDEARGLFEESLALSRAQNNLWGMADSLRYLGFLAMFQGRFDDAARRLRQSIALCQESGDRFRRAFDLSQLGVAHCLSGQFIRAHAALEEAVAIGQGLGDPLSLALFTAHQARVNVHVGQYEEARAQAHTASTLARGVHDVWIGGVAGLFARQILGWTALAEEQYAEAARWMGETVAGYHQMEHEREWLAWALVPLGRAAHGLGNRSEAQRHLFEALGIAVDIGAFIPLLHLMPIIPVVLADAGEVERAVELYALAESHPFVASSQLFEGIAGRFVEAAAATLPSDMVAAARERGQALDWWDTAAGLLDELPKLGWTD